MKDNDEDSYSLSFFVSKTFLTYYSFNYTKQKEKKIMNVTLTTDAPTII